jgi:hypothetical protein
MNKWLAAILAAGMACCGGCELAGDGEDDATEITVTGDNNTIVTGDGDTVTTTEEEETSE